MDTSGELLTEVNCSGSHLNCSLYTFSVFSVILLQERKGIYSEAGLLYGTYGKRSVTSNL